MSEDGMKLLICKIRTHLKIWKLSLGFIPRVTAGSIVWYNGKMKRVGSYHWVKSCSIIDLGGGNYQRVLKSDIKKVHSLKSYINDIRMGLRFYYGYWFDIWVNDLYFGKIENHGKINHRG